MAKNKPIAKISAIIASDFSQGSMVHPILSGEIKCKKCNDKWGFYNITGHELDKRINEYFSSHYHVKSYKIEVKISVETSA